MKKAFLSITLWLSIGHLMAQTTYSKEIEEQIKQVENNLAARVIINGKADNILERMAYFKVKGLSIAVIDNYKVVWAKGYGWADEKEKRPVTTETLFEPGSISKSLNAVGVLKLAQVKKLDLNTDINTYLKSWKFPYDTLSKGKKITLTHLLSHSAGISFNGSLGYTRKSKIPTLAEILDGKAPSNSPGVRSEFEPGLQHQYSNGGIVMTQLMITDITKQPYAQFMYDNVLKPLGMTQSFFNQPPPNNKLKWIATGYTADGIELATKFNIIPEQSAGGLWTTPTELCKYIIETQMAYQGKSSKVLSPEMTKLRLTPTVDEVSALGVFIDKRGETKYFTHDARNYGFCGVYYGSMEGGKGVAIFLNSDNVSLLPEIVNSVATVYKWKEFYNPVFRKEITLSESILEKYKGVYLFDNKLASVFKKKDGYYYWTDGLSSKMHFSSEKEFFNQEFRAEKTFVSDAAGNITGFIRKVDGKEYPFAIKITNADTLKAPANQINNLAWHLLENKQYEEAINYLKRGILLEPNDKSAVINLAHCYLFKNEYDKAIKLYTEHLNKDMLKQDFVFFKKNGFDASLMDKVFAELKMEIPDGY
ncbi:serine hydrolase [Runella sp.]|uniref:serine hydrolase n=1 Tax=Runella sp. TaxID=1960881 RepID=UPI003D0A3653